MNKSGIICLIIVLCILIVFLVSILVMNMVGISWMPTFIHSGTVQRTSENIKKTSEFDIAQFKDLNLDFTSSDVNLYITDSSNIKIVEYSNKDLEQDELFVTSNTSTSLNVSEPNLSSHFFRWFKNYNSAFDVYIPKTYSENLDFHSVSGNIKLEEELHLKDVSIQMTSGDINIKNTLTTKELFVKTVSGEISLNNVVCDKAEISSTSGDIEIDSINNDVTAKSVSGTIEIGNVDGKINAKTTSGNIKINNFKINGNSEMKSTSGEVYLTMNQDSNCTINAKSVSGDIDLPNNRNTIGSNPSNTLKIETTSGNIDIRI